MTRVKFATPARRHFRTVLNERVDAYFAAEGISRHADWRMVLKTVVYVGGFLACVVALATQPLGTASFLGLAVLTGLFTACIGFNVGHDAAHGGYSSKGWVNRLVAHSFTLVGAHVYTWKIIHNVIHHTYTNIPYSDGDLHSVPAIRYFEDKGSPRKPYPRFQHIYCFALYCLATLVWVFRKDYQHMNKKEHCGYVKPVPPKSEWVMLYVTKFTHYITFLILPWAIADQPLALVLGGFVLMHIAAGLSLASVFAVGHLVDDVQVVETDANHRVNDEWAAHQLRTTANFSTKSAFFWWTVGGLNFQIEHHLLPTVCHVHYKALAPIVKATAAEFGLPYIEYPTVWQALAGHVRFMRRYGEPLAAPTAAPVSTATA